jgi:hypothetical protein
MTLSANQSKRGTEHETSTNPTKKTGRDSGFEQVQGGVRGNRHGVSGPDNGKATRPVPKETQTVTGVKQVAGGDGAGSVKQVGDEGGTTSRSI